MANKPFQRIRPKAVPPLSSVPASPLSGTLSRSAPPWRRQPGHWTAMALALPCLRNTIEFLGIWESLDNPVFKPLEFDGFRRET